jgi:ATP-dependent DNA helicase PIF1
MTFSKEQAYAFEKFKKGENLFITGPGGTGKTHLIHEMIKWLNEQGSAYQVCAMTGCAAVLIGKGTKTLHSWCGMGLASGPKDKIVQKICYNKRTGPILRRTKVLIIDEVSMLSKKIIEILNTALKFIRRSQAPFGGMQVIMTGDFFQLPPVGNAYDEETCQFCFESPVWKELFGLKNHIVLRHIFRQKEEIYKKILDQIRWGELDEESEMLLRGRLQVPVEGDVRPTKLFAVRAKADYINSRMYEKLEGEERIYPIQTKTNLRTYVESGKLIEMENIIKCDELSHKDKIAEDLMNNSNRVHQLALKCGAAVMCLHNICIEQGICNGSQGIIVGFAADTFPIVRFSNGHQMSIEPIWIQSEEFPCIGISQIPLCLAWALTIHKIQGATLAMGEMDLGHSVFEYGQTYVALSRIQSLDGLFLSAFHPKKIKASPIVKEFYRAIPEHDYSNEENVFKSFELQEEASPSVKEVSSTVKIIRL